MVEYVTYVDDLLILVEGNSRPELERRGGGYMHIVNMWSLKVGFVLKAHFPILHCRVESFILC